MTNAHMASGLFWELLLKETSMRRSTLRDLNLCSCMQVVGSFTRCALKIFTAGGTDIRAAKPTQTSTWHREKQSTKCCGSCVRQSASCSAARLLHPLQVGRSG